MQHICMSRWPQLSNSLCVAHSVQVPFWMFHLLLEDIAIQCHSFSESKINAHTRNSVWQEANTQYYVRQIFGAGGSKTLLPGAIDVRDGICLNVNGPGGASATIIVRRCCAVSVYVMRFGMNKGSTGARQSSSHALQVRSTGFATLPCAFCKDKRKGFSTPEPTTNLPLNEPKHHRKEQQQTDESQPKKRCKTPTHLPSSLNYSTPLPPLSGLTRGACKLRVPEVSGFCISAPPAPKTPRGHLRHPDPIGGSKKDSKHKATTITPIIRAVVSRRLDFQVPASETKYLAQMNTSELFDLHFTASDGKHSSDEDEASQSSQTDGFDPVFSQLPRIPEGLV